MDVVMLKVVSWTDVNVDRRSIIEMDVTRRGYNFLPYFQPGPIT